MVKFGNISSYTTDPEIEKNGIDVFFPKEKFYITIRRSGGANTEFKNKMAEALKNAQSNVGKKELSEKEEDYIIFELFASTVVLGWRNLLDDKGKDIPFSVKNCIDLFVQSEEIYSHLSKSSNNLENFRHKEVKESGKE